MRPMIEHALRHLVPEDESVLFIENVGNLVCPAEFDLGEAYKVVLLSVTEGEDKPLKYPDMFRAADLMILTKTDLLPYVPFDAEKAEENARRRQSPHPHDARLGRDGRRHGEVARVACRRTDAVGSLRDGS